MSEIDDLIACSAHAYCAKPCLAFRSQWGPVRCTMLRGHDGPCHFAFYPDPEPEKP